MNIPKIPLGKWALLSALSTLLSVSWAATPQEQERIQHFTVLHTNDHHGHFWPSRDGEYGLAAQKTVIDRIRAEVKQQGGHTLLLSAGDVNTGSPESNLLDAEPDFKAMDAIGYDAMVLGNHEFDKPLTVLNKQRGWVRFPMLSANIYSQNKRLFPPYSLFKLGGLRVAVLGLTTEDTTKLTNPNNINGLTFRSARAEAAELIPSLRNVADIVIALTHLGHYPDGKHGLQAPGDVELARTVNGIDVIVGGHTHSTVCMVADNVRAEPYVPGTPCRPDRQNGTWIVQAGSWGKYVGRADFEFNGRQLRLANYQLIPINLTLKKTSHDAVDKSVHSLNAEKIIPDPAMVKLLASYQQHGHQALSQPIGQINGSLGEEPELVRQQPVGLAVFTAKIFMDKLHADFAVLNGGKIRDVLHSGVVTYKDVLRYLPFGNNLAYVEMTGRDVMDFLNMAAKMSPGSGGFAQFAGIHLTIKQGKVIDASIKGKPIQATQRYRMATDSFLAAGGDGYPKLEQHPGFVATDWIDADVVKDYIATHSPINAADFAPGDAVIRH